MGTGRTADPAGQEWRWQAHGEQSSVSSSARRCSAIEPIIGHLKAKGHLGRCYLKGRAGDASNVILSAMGHNFRCILAWLRHFWRLFLIAARRTSSVLSQLKSAS
jgi:transposase, IS5 family